MIISADAIRPNVNSWQLLLPLMLSENFLKVLDNFERAEDAARKSDDAAGIYSGIEMIRRQFEQTFKDLGVEEIKSTGRKI